MLLLAVRRDLVAPFQDTRLQNGFLGATDAEIAGVAVSSGGTGRGNPNPAASIAGMSGGC